MKNNKIIAEFMGLETIDRCYFEHLTKEGNRELTHHILLKYHTSWDWLMPVVGKLLDLDEPASVSDHSYRLKDALVETNIDSMYDMAVEFINEYNKTI